LSEQRLTAYQGDTAVFSSLVSTGVAGRRTPVGNFAVRTKVRAQTMSGPGYNLPNVQWVMYFAGENAIHGTYWHKNFGHPMSHGCVNLPTAEAGWLYKWASIGTPVVTHD
jgi:lipoprotein-anchoring transpeptidase ErfK/SrfK